MLKVFMIYLFILNFTALVFMASDKRRAKKGRWRIAEKTLMGLAIFGGSIGICLGMHLFHHKTQKPLFRFGIPVILFLQILAAVFVLYYQNFMIH